MANSVHLVRRASAHGEDERQGWLAFCQIISQIFAGFVIITGVIQQIVYQLECCA